MKKNLKEYVIVLTIIILVGLLLIIGIKNISRKINEEWQTLDDEELMIRDNEIYSINFYSDGTSYNISLNKNDDNYVYVKQTINNKCGESINGQCSDPVHNNYEIRFKESNMNVIKGLIIDLSNKYGDTIINENDLNSYELRIMKSIIKNDESYLAKDENVYYKLMYATNNGELKAKGYILNKYVEYTSVDIGLGSKSNSGYSLNLKEVKKVDNDIYIIVEEIKPNNDGTYMNVIVYPSIGINIYDDYNNIIVKDTNNNIFSEIIID